MLKVLFVANTVIGRRGNIGYRLQKIIDNLETDEYASISREGFQCNENQTPKILRYLITQFFRALNAIRIYVWREFPQKIIERNVFFLLFLTNYLLHREKLKGIKVVHLTDLDPRIIKFSQKRGIRVILDIPIAPSSYVEELNNKYGKLLAGNSSELKQELSAIKTADHILVPSEFVQAEVLKLNQEASVELLPFGVDIEQFSPLPDRPSMKPPKFVFAGNISRRKGIIYLLKAWSEVVERYPTSELHLCGRLYPEANELINKLNLHSSVFTPGFIDVSSYFITCDVYVFPSLMEGSSKSIYEAMACGLPVITTFESGSVVRNGVDGIIIPKCSSDEIREVLLKFCSGHYNYKLMSSAARQNIANYSWRRYSDHNVKLIRSLCAN